MDEPILPDARVFTCMFTDWRRSVRHILDAAGLAARLQRVKTVLVKPNLVEDHPPPITTPVELAAALVAYLRDAAPHVEIIIGEGCGSLSYDTRHVFASLGYEDLARQMDITLLDLNDMPLVKRTNRRCRRWPEMYLPEVVFSSFLLSIPVLKAHSLAGVTLTMKNMMGLAPSAHYQQGGHWKKAAFHDRVQEAVLDLNRYRTPDFTLLDATVGMQEAHLWGPCCDPPPNRLAAGFDPVAVDAYGCMLLKRDWREIGHIRMAHKELGRAEPLEVVEVGDI